MVLEGFEAVAGKWTLVKNELGFEEYLQLMGVGYVKRKIAASMSSTMELVEVAENRVRIICKGPRNIDETVSMDSQYRSVDPFGNEMVSQIRWDPVAKVMRTDADPTAGSRAKKSIVKRTPFGDDELVMEVTLPNDNIVFRQYFKRCDS